MEKGSAEIKIKLWNGKIKVTHTEHKMTLAEWIASEGDWDRIWATIDKLVKKNNGYKAGR